MTNARSQILVQQQDWAANRKIAVDRSGYTETRDANLFQPLHPDTLADFQRGSGDELGRNFPDRCGGSIQAAPKHG